MDRAPSGWIGSVLQDRFRIDAKIARGGVATVFKGFDLQTGQKVAVKIMHPEFSRNQDARGRFLREGYVANKVGHPLVVKVLADAALPDSTVFLVMELLEDGELLEAKRERLGGKMPVEEAVRIGDQILDVLNAAHTQDIVHRDIKPENIFVLPDGKVKVLDFGIAHLKESAMKGGESTATGLLLGTPDFMSPEQAMGMRGTIDAASDIYAVGATLFVLVSGEAVHTDMNLASLLHSTSMKQARSLGATKAGPTLPRELVAVIDKALMLQKAHRWPSARAMQNALRQAVPAARSVVPESAKTRPFSPIDMRPGASVRSTGKAPLAPSVPPAAPVSEGVPTPREASPWEADFADGDMEGPTVATNEFPALPALQKAQPPQKSRDEIEPEHLEPDELITGQADFDDIHTTQAMTGDLLAQVAAPRPAAPSMPPPPVHTPSMPPPHHAPSMPPPAYHTPSMPPPVHTPSMPPPYYSQPPPMMGPPVGPPTPRGQMWGPMDSGGVAIMQHAPSIPPPMHAPSIPPPQPSIPPPQPRQPSPTKRTKPASVKKPTSILVAEIVLALLVVVTLTIGGCLLLQSR